MHTGWEMRAVGARRGVGGGKGRGGEGRRDKRGRGVGDWLDGGGLAGGTAGTCSWGEGEGWGPAAGRSGGGWTAPRGSAELWRSDSDAMRLLRRT